MNHPAGIPTPRVDFAARPMLVFWEITRSCLLACRHCRASATAAPLPGELDHAEGLHLIDQVAGFGRPYPILVLTPESIARMASSGVKAVSLSLDGACGPTHDGIRGITGHFEESLPAIRAIVDAGIKLQINTTVMSGNVHELPDIAKIVKDYGVDMWEVFFLVHVGRGEATGAISPQEHEDVCHFLFDASHHGFVVRTVEAPFFRRVVHTRRTGGGAPATPLYAELSGRLTMLLGEGRERASAHTAATRDGKGIVFVAHDGEVHPAGFLPLGLGSVREQPLAEIYRDHPTLRAIRAAEFSGRCGTCEYADLCGGSRARAYASSGDPLGEDAACIHQPGALLTTGSRVGVATGRAS